LKEIPSRGDRGAGAWSLSSIDLPFFGTEVTIVECCTGWFQFEDEMSQGAGARLSQAWIAFHTGAKVEKVEPTKSGIACTIA